MFDVVNFRHALHRHPECGFDVQNTAKNVADILRNAGLAVVENVGKTGIVATLQGPDGSGAIGFRADMDALPIQETNSFSHRSEIDGHFHGCGHDGHTTMLLAAALELVKDNNLKTTIHFIFQPDEENGNGAKAMIADRLFERFPMQAIYGIHNMPGLPLGHFATQKGSFCSFEDNFEIKLQGKGGHASMPEIGVDPIVLGASIVLQLQSIVSRNISAQDHAVISITEFVTDGARNILASNVVIRGDCRGFKDEVSQRIESRMDDIVSGLAAAQGATATLDYSRSFQPLVNSPQETELAVKAAASVGEVNGSYGRVGFSEDFAEFLHHCPGAYLLIGNGTEGSNGMPLHNSAYDFNDDAVIHGINFWCALARSF